MISISVGSKVKLSRFKVAEVRKIGLYNASEALRGIAAGNAPYASGKLSQSIAREPGAITEQTTQVRIGPRKLVYAVIREFVNYKNPHKKFYMQRTYKVAPWVVQKEFQKAVDIVSNHLK